jgi:hypothetical protein
MIWAPAATFDAILLCDIEGCAIHTCLSARNDFHFLRRI